MSDKTEKEDNTNCQVIYNQQNILQGYIYSKAPGHKFASNDNDRFDPLGSYIKTNSNAGLLRFLRSTNEVKNPQEFDCLILAIMNQVDLASFDNILSRLSISLRKNITKNTALCDKVILLAASLRNEDYLVSLLRTYYSDRKNITRKSIDSYLNKLIAATKYFIDAEGNNTLHRLMQDYNLICLIDKDDKLKNYISTVFQLCPDPNAKNLAGLTPVMLLVKDYGYIEIIEQYKQLNLVNLDYHGNNLFFYAIQGHAPVGTLIKLLELMLKAGFDINQRNKEGETAIFYISHRLVISDHYEIFLNLYKFGAKLDLKDYNGNSLLHVMKCPKIIRFLLQNTNLSIHDKNLANENVFYNLAPNILETNVEETLSFLEEHNLEINSPLPNGSYLILEAMKRKKSYTYMIQDVMACALLYGLNLYVQDSKGNNLVHISAQKYPTWLPYLIMNGIADDLLTTNNDGQNILHLFCSSTSYEGDFLYKTYIETVEWLFSYLRTTNLNWEHKDIYGKTPIDYLRKLQPKEVIEAYRQSQNSINKDDNLSRYSRTFKKGISYYTDKPFDSYEHFVDMLNSNNNYNRFASLIDTFFYLNRKYSKQQIKDLLNKQDSSYRNLLMIALDEGGLIARERKIPKLLSYFGAEFPNYHQKYQYSTIIEKLVKSSINPAIFPQFRDNYFIIHALSLELLHYGSNYYLEDLLKSINENTYTIQDDIYLYLFTIGSPASKKKACLKPRNNITKEHIARYLLDHEQEFFTLINAHAFLLMLKKFGDFLLPFDQFLQKRAGLPSTSKRFGSLEYIIRNIKQSSSEKTLELIRYLIEKLGYDLNEHIEYTPLASVIISKRYDSKKKFIEYLIKMGADFNKASGPDKITPIFLAITNHADQCLDILMSHRKSRQKLKILDIEQKNTLLLQAIKVHAYTFLEKFVFEYKPNLLAKNNNDQNLLHILAANKQFYQSQTDILIREKIIKEALTQGINPNIKDKTGMTPLHYAIKSDQEELFFSLIELGADTSIKSGKPPLPLVYYANTKHVFDFLIEDMKTTPRLLENLYYRFCSNFNVAIKDANMLDFFLHSGYSIEHKFKDGKTAIALLQKNIDFMLPKGYIKRHFIDGAFLTKLVNNKAQQEI